MSILDKATLLVTPNAYKTNKLYSIMPTNGDGDFTFTRVGNATRTNENGYIETVGTGIPRIDYTLGVNCPVIETEVQRTNMIAYSEDMTQSTVYGLTNTTIPPNQFTTAPDGQNTANKVIPNSTNGKHKISIAHTLGTITTTISVFAKKGELNKFKLGLTSDATVGAIFNLENGTTTTPETGNSTTAKIIPYGSNWYRCCVTGLVSLGGTCETLILDESGNETYSGDGSKGLYLWGWQIEGNPNLAHNCYYVTSYIPTSGAIQTRTGELLNITNLISKGILGATEGTLYIHIVDNFMAKKNANVTTERAFTLAPTTAFSAAGVISIRRLTNNSNPGIRLEVAYTNTTTATLQAWITTAPEVKLAIKFKISSSEGYLKVFQNGNSGTSNLPFLNNTQINVFGGNPNEPGTLNFKSLALFNTILSDVECQTLTTL